MLVLTPHESEVITNKNLANSMTAGIHQNQNLGLDGPALKISGEGESMVSSAWVETFILHCAYR